MAQNGSSTGPQPQPFQSIRGFWNVDVAGRYRAATVVEIGAQGWSLSPGRYVGVAEREEDGGDFLERLEILNEELETLNGQARRLEECIAQNVPTLQEAE